MMRNSLCVAALVLLVAVPLAADEPIDFCAFVQTSGIPSAPGGLTSDIFSVRTTEDLEFLVLFMDEIKGEHILELKMKTPRDHHYQTLTAPITSQAAERGAVRAVPTYPRPLPVQPLQRYETREGALQGTTMRMPVAGTSIVTGSLYGKWHIEVILDGQPMPCKIENSFTLTE